MAVQWGSRGIHMELKDLLDHAGYNGELTNETDNNTMRAGWDMHENTASKSPTMKVSWEHHPGNLRQKLP